jgi:DNA-binding NarL/FixJ family response regulator
MRRLLLVEDHTLFREGLALLLKWRTGLGIVQAGSLAEAERILTDAKDKPACAIVDLDLPDGAPGRCRPGRIRCSVRRPRARRSSVQRNC